MTEMKLIIFKMQNFRWLLPLPGALICGSLAFYSTLTSGALHSRDPPVPLISCHHSCSLCLVHTSFALAFFTLPARILTVPPTSTADTHSEYSPSMTLLSINTQGSYSSGF